MKPRIYQCNCGEITGTPCYWSGPRKDMVIIEYIQDFHRGSYRAAGNRGEYPHNGARRLLVEKWCAKALVFETPEWVSIVSE